jgi:hypothetical protein
MRYIGQTGRTFRVRFHACLCSGGWQDSLGVILSVVVGFLYISKERFSFPSYIVMSRKLTVLSISFSIVNFIVGTRLLKELKPSSVSVMESLYAMCASSTYRKYPEL